MDVDKGKWGETGDVMCHVVGLDNFMAIWP